MRIARNLTWAAPAFATLFVVLFVGLVPAKAQVQQRTDANVPTGYQVRGHGAYILRNGRVVQVNCNDIKSWTNQRYAEVCRSNGGTNPTTSADTQR